MSRCPPEATPFVGLGFDLSDLMARTMLMRLVPQTHVVETGLRLRDKAVPHPYSYGLLLRLSREIRGR